MFAFLIDLLSGSIEWTEALSALNTVIITVACEEGIGKEEINYVSFGQPHFSLTRILPTAI